MIPKDGEQIQVFDASPPSSDPYCVKKPLLLKKPDLLVNLVSEVLKNSEIHLTFYFFFFVRRRPSSVRVRVRSSFLFRT